MRQANVYLIKQAVNIARLAQTAKRWNIPLEADWRYAARLARRAELSRNPAAAAHYQKVLGFPTTEEMSSLKAELSRLQNPSSDKYLEELATRRTNDIADPRSRFYAREALLDPEVPYEAAVVQYAGKSPQTIPGYPGSVILPHEEKWEKARFTGAPVPANMKSPQLQRVLHTHPAIDPERLRHVSAFRHGDLGRVFPSSGIDSPVIPTEPWVRAQSAIPLMEAVTAIPQKMREESVPSDITSALGLLKRRISNGTMSAVGDVHAIMQRVPGTYPIYAPDSSASSVLKGGGGVLKHLYFRGPARPD